MFANAVAYLRSEMTTKVKNKVIYNLELFNNSTILASGDPWWEYDDGKGDHVINIAVNMEKILFLQHLIKKLR